MSATIESKRDTVVSRHNTSQGVVIWVRCNLCGSVRMQLQPLWPDGQALSAGGHADRCGYCA